VCGFSIFYLAHFNLVARRKRFELVFHRTNTDISQCSVLSASHSLSFSFSCRQSSSSKPNFNPIVRTGPQPMVLVTVLSAFSYWSRGSNRVRPPQKCCARFDFLARFSFGPSHIARSWTWTFVAGSLLPTLGYKRKRKYMCMHTYKSIYKYRKKDENNKQQLCIDKLPADYFRRDPCVMQNAQM